MLFVYGLYSWLVIGQSVHMSFMIWNGVSSWRIVEVFVNNNLKPLSGGTLTRYDLKIKLKNGINNDNINTQEEVEAKCIQLDLT